MKYYVLMILFVGALFCQEATKFETISDMMSEFNDYSIERNTFEILSDFPLHIRLSPEIVAGDPPENINFFRKQTMLYGIFRTFIHTNIEAVTVTVVPLQISLSGGKSRFIDRHATTYTVKRGDLLNLVNKYNKVDSFDSFVTTKHFDTFSINDNWSDLFYSYYLQHEAYPGINRFYLDLQTINNR